MPRALIRLAGMLASLAAITAAGACLAFGPVSMFFEAQGQDAAASGVNHLSDLANVDITVDEVVVSGLDHPVHVTHAGDGSGRLFIVEQRGIIRIVKNGSLLSTPFLDITDRVEYGGEQGLLSVAFPPDYASGQHFYVNYTRKSDGNSRVSRFSASGDVANPASEAILLTVTQPYANHNGGQLAFGPNDGYLYIGMGDGGSGGDPQNYAQNPNSLLGKMLRIDVESGTAPYAIPTDNPFVGTGSGRDEIWALGLRNPWRFSFDRATGDMYIADVGQNAWEEIDFQAANTWGGLNFGWRCQEGTHEYDFTGSCPSLSLVDPIAEYSRDDGRSVTGGFVYRGALYPALVGRYFYGDYVTGNIWSIVKTGSYPTTWSPIEFEINAGFPISSFGEDEQGELYVADYGGTIRRLADVNGPSPNLSLSSKRASTPHASAGEVVTYTIQINNRGASSTQTVYLTDTIPSGLDYVPGSLFATEGNTDVQGARLYWQGPLSTPVITITYRATVDGSQTGSLMNRAQLAGAAISPLQLAVALYVPSPVLTTTENDVFLPGTQPGTIEDTVATAAGCDFCHTGPIYDRWRGSPMGQAGRDPLMWAALSVTNNTTPDTGDFCLRCHTPKGWLDGRSHPADGSALQDVDMANGVTCDFCHRLVDPIPSSSDEARGLDSSIRAALTTTVPLSNMSSGMFIVDPGDNRRGPFTIAPPPPHTAYKTDFLGQSTDALTESRLCGTCHNLDNPLFSWDSGRNQYWPNGSGLQAPSFGKDDLLPVERTFDEWANSQYNTAGGVFAPQFAGAKPDGIVRSCQDCHMYRTTGQAAEGTYTPTTRDCTTSGCLPEHRLVGGNTWLPELLQDARWRLHDVSDSDHLDTALSQTQEMLGNSATLTVLLNTDGSAVIALVRVTNQTGHKLPTGHPEGRRIWINLKAYDGQGTLVSESGAYDPATGVLTRDTQLKVYEIKPGITPELAGLLDLPDVPTGGESFYFLLNNMVVKDNRIPPRGYTQTAFDKPGLRPVGASYANGQYWDDTRYTLPAETDRVTVTLYYQTASKEYVDFLRNRGGLDGATLGQMWDDSKSPPQIIDRVYAPGETYLPLISKS